jgi:DNA-binding transcriptional MerR regulator
MSESELPAIPIGAVTQLTGISSHTLRKWESRYGAIEPLRTETGRRLYDQQQVRRLILLRDLIEQGHQISRLSGMSDEELTALMAESPRQAPEMTRFDRVIVVGQVLPAMLSKADAGGEIDLVTGPAAEWLREAVETFGSERAAPDEALVVELPTVPEQCVDDLVALRRGRFARIVVIYGFAAQRTLRALMNAGMLCLKAPANPDEVLRNLHQSDRGAPVLEALEDPTVPAHRFSSESIARLAALSPKLQCECPNHIAELLLDISAFEQYCMECEDQDPKERFLHARLRLITANARALFEEAMAEVAANEGLELNEL